MGTVEPLSVPVPVDSVPVVLDGWKRRKNLSLFGHFHPYGHTINRELQRWAEYEQTTCRSVKPESWMLQFKQSLFLSAPETANMVHGKDLQSRSNFDFVALFFRRTTSPHRPSFKPVPPTVLRSAVLQSPRGSRRPSAQRSTPPARTPSSAAGVAWNKNGLRGLDAPGWAFAGFPQNPRHHLKP